MCISLIKNKQIQKSSRPTAWPMITTFAVIYLFFSQIVVASNFILEKQISDQLENSRINGNTVWLKAGKQKFFSLYLEAVTAKPRGGVIFLHGMAAHPDWPRVISPLRQRLPDSGWATLSLQMPILLDDALIEEYIPLIKEVPQRITSAIEFYHSKGIYNIIIVGHGLGATMGANFLASESRSASVISAFVGIGLGIHNQYREFNPSYSIAKIKIPFLDLFGSLDLDSVIKSASTRRLVARKINNKRYRQTNILGADHFFTGLNKQLVSRVDSWLKKYAPSKRFDKEQLLSNKPKNN